MPEEQDLSPSGADIVSTGTSGLGDFGRALGGLFVTGLSRRIDLEFTEREQRIDTAEVARQRQQQFAPPGFGSVVQNLTPLQVGGLLVAAALSVALISGAFR